MKKPEKLTGEGDSGDNPFGFGRVVGFNQAWELMEAYHQSLNLVSREVYDNKLQAIKSLRKQKKELLRRLGENNA